MEVLKPWIRKLSAIFFIFLVGQVFQVSCQNDITDGDSCDPKAIEHCVKLADPLVKEPKNIFPTTLEEVEQVCKVVFPQTWSEFIACIRSFTSNCLSNNQRIEVNRAIGDSINSVHKLCTNDDYKNAFLKKSECIHGKATSDENCKIHYDKLVALMQDPSNEVDLCCAHESFKLCIVEESKDCSCPDDDCSTEDTNFSASHFAKVTMENSLGFLLRQCNNQIDPKPCVGGYVIKVPIVEPAPDFHSSQSDSYFPVEDDRILTEDAGATTIRQTKEVATNEDLIVSEFLDNQFLSNNNPDDPDTLHVEPVTVVPTTPPPTPLPGIKYPSWLPEADIKDFDEFLRNTLNQAGFSPQGLRSSGVQNHLTLYAVFLAPMIAAFIFK